MIQLYRQYPTNGILILKARRQRRLFVCLRLLFFLFFSIFFSFFILHTLANDEMDLWPTLFSSNHMPDRTVLSAAHQHHKQRFCNRTHRTFSRFSLIQNTFWMYYVYIVKNGVSSAIFNWFSWLKWLNLADIYAGHKICNALCICEYLAWSKNTWLNQLILWQPNIQFWGQRKFDGYIVRNISFNILYKSFGIEKNNFSFVFWALTTDANPFIFNCSNDYDFNNNNLIFHSFSVIFCRNKSKREQMM